MREELAESREEGAVCLELLVIRKDFDLVLYFWWEYSLQQLCNYFSLFSLIDLLG